MSVARQTTTARRGAPKNIRELAQRAFDAQGITSGRALELLTERHGAKISYTVLNAMRAGTYTSAPTAATIRTLAALAGISERQAFTAAGRSVLEPFTLPETADTLTGEQRDAVLSIVRAFVNANRGE